MKIELMRHIDFWLGLPICFFLSIFNSFKRIIGSKAGIKPISPQKILFIKLSEIGSIILAYPLLKLTKEEYPSAKILFLTFKKNKEIFKLLKGAVEDEDILTIQDDSFWRFILDTFKTIIRMRKEKIDIVFDLEFFSRFTAILTYLSKADRRIGFYRYNMEGLYRGKLLTHQVQYNPLIHISKTYLSLFQVIKVRKKLSPDLQETIEDKEITLPRFISNRQTRESVERKLVELGVNKESGLFLINAGEGNLPLREWALENFIILSKKILADSHNYIILIGTREASEKAGLLYTSVQDKRCINLTGKTTLIELLELFNLSDALICNDCGLAHLASLASIKKFIIFGPESPQIFSPLGEHNYIIYSSLPCSPCLSAFNHRNSACMDNRCLKNISPDQVSDLVISNI